MESNYRYHGGQEQLMASPRVPMVPYSTYRSVGAATMASPLQRTSPMTPSNARIPPSPSNNHMRQPSGRSIQSSPRLVQIGTPQSSVGRSAFSMSPPPAVGASPRMQRTQQTSNNRRLPQMNITRDNIDMAYTAFILYCNPTVPSSTDTSQLRKAFKIPPKSEGKTFDVFKLWELIRRLDSGELKTWIQLALELGVDPPSTDNGQSTQKIQQYAVRLKRWMHAMHIDAFFEYCLGKPHVYYMQIPLGSANETFESRDGVPPQEDLALRALLPDWKPKRGRRKAGEQEEREADGQRPSKRPNLEISSAMLEYQGLESGSMFPQGTLTWSSFPDDPESQGPWDAPGLAISAPPSQTNNTVVRDPTDQRWNRALSPSAYPQSAIEQSYTIEDALDIPEPRSAIAPNSSAKTGRTRRRYASAISSAWPSTHASSSNKLRGRPPVSRATQSGPSITTSVDAGDTDDIDKSQPTSFPRPPSVNSLFQRPPSVNGSFPRPPSANNSFQPSALHAPRPRQGKPRKLQLQVPQYVGGPVRLATPPMVMVNAETTAGGRSGRASADLFRASDGGETFEGVMQEESLLEIKADDVVHAFASRILHGRLMGRQGSLSLEEATLIAHKAVAQLQNGWAAELPEDSFAVRCATALGVSSDLDVGSGAASIITVKCMPQPLLGVSRGRARSMGNADARNGMEYVLSFDIVHGNGISSSVQIHNIFVPLHLDSEAFTREIESLRTIIASADNEIDTMTHDHRLSQDDRSWKEKCAALERELQRKDAQLRKMKRRVLEVVMADTNRTLA